jgi:uncharacterized membrane protein
MHAVLLAIAAGVCWGIGEVATKSVLHSGRIGPITAIAVRTTVALPLLWLAYLVVVRMGRHEPTDWTGAPASTLTKLVLGSGVVAGALAMLAFYGALHLGEVSRVKPIAFSVAPMVGVVLGVLVLGEPLTAKKCVGVLLILAGVVVLTMR